MPPALAQTDDAVSHLTAHSREREGESGRERERESEGERERDMTVMSGLMEGTGMCRGKVSYWICAGQRVQERWVQHLSVCVHGSRLTSLPDL